MEDYQLLLLYSVLISIAIAVVYRFLTDPAELRRIKKQLREYNKKIKAARGRGDTENMEKFLGEVVKLNQENLRLMMKPMLISMLIIFISISYFSQAFSDLVLKLPFYVPFIGTEINWFWWYFICALPATIISRKLLGVI